MNLAQWIVTGALRIYQCVVSPVLHTLIGPFGGCRFHPTCSEYAREAITRHGVGRGGWLTAKRICKCQPWGSCGHDPVPEAGRSSGPPSPLFIPPSQRSQMSIRHRRTWLSGAPINPSLSPRR